MRMTPVGSLEEDEDPVMRIVGQWDRLVDHVVTISKDASNF
jgi:hypothetical protein